MRLGRRFFEQNTLDVAQQLLGQYLVREINGKKLIGKITETEAYCGPHDLACHASKGRTPRTEVMFGKAGFSYVYMIYGMYNCLNIVTEKVDSPAAVLIRSLEPVEGIELMKKSRGQNTINNLTTGPGKLCQALSITKEHNNLDATKTSMLYIRKGTHIKPSQIVKKKRIGIDYAGAYKDKLWRFYIKNNNFISQK